MATYERWRMVKYYEEIDSGFLLDSTPDKFATTNKTGFKSVVASGTRQATLNYWHGEKETVSWDYYGSSIYMKGKKYDLGLLLSFSFIVAAAKTADKIVLLTLLPSGGHRIYFLNSAANEILGASNELSNVVNIYNGACFNKSATKLVFIGRTNAMSALSPPAMSLTNPCTTGNFPNAISSNAQALHASCTYTLPEQYANSSEPYLSNIGSHNNTAVLSSSYYRGVYRVDINTTEMTATANVVTEYQAHVYKVSMTASGSTIYDGLGGYTSTGESNATASVINNSPYTTAIFFDKNDIEQTEIAESGFDLLVNTSISTEKPSITNSSIMSFEKTINASIFSKLTSSLGIFEKTSVTNETATGECVDSILIQSASSVCTHQYNVNEVESGFNRFIPNIYYAESAFSLIEKSPQPDFNSFNRVFKQYDVTKTTNFSAAITPFLIGDIISSGITFSSVGWSRPNYDRVDGAVNGENYVIIAEQTRLYRNGIITAHADRHGNMIYALNNGLVSPTQTGCKIYKANFAAESPEKQAEISAIVSTPSQILGVV